MTNVPEQLEFASSWDAICTSQTNSNRKQTRRVVEKFQERDEKIRKVELMYVI